jgi:hypothetical protein
MLSETSVLVSGIEYVKMELGIRKWKCSYHFTCIYSVLLYLYKNYIWCLINIVPQFLNSMKRIC